MTSFFRIKKKWLEKIVSSLVLCALIILPLSPFFAQKAEAIPVYDAANFGVNTANLKMDTITAGAAIKQLGVDMSIWMKEFTLDNVAWMLINMTIQAMSKSIVAWINSGFQGSPSFVTDFGSFLTGIADKAFGAFVWGSPLNGLCSPFKLDVKIALDIQYKKSRDYKSQCSLTSIMNNISGFANSANAVTNWDSWHKVALTPENNVYGALLQSQEALGVYITNQKGQRVELLKFSGGFFDKQKCTTVNDESGGHTKCTTVTPGATIQNQLNTALNLPAGRLQIADEINEIIAALFAQLAQQALSGAAGLLGLTNGGSDGSPSYFERVDNATTTVGYTKTGNPILDAINTERSWRSVQNEHVNMINAAEDFIAGTCMPEEELPAALAEKRDTSVELTAVANIAISRLTVLSNQYNAASATQNGAQTNADVMNEFMTMQSSGTLHNESDVFTYKMITLQDTLDAIAAFKQTVTAECTRRANEAGGGGGDGAG